MKVEQPTYDALRYYKAHYDTTIAGMVGRTMLFFVEHNADEIAQKEAEFIERGRQIPVMLREAFGEEAA